jgi:transposase
LSKEDTRPSNRKGKPNYPLEYKRRVAVAACEPGISVAKLAQVHGLNPNMVFKWRREYRAGRLSQAKTESAVLVAVGMAPEAAIAPALSAPRVMPDPPPVSGIEIELNGALVRVSGAVDPIQLRLVLRCLMPV